MKKVFAILLVASERVLQEGIPEGAEYVQMPLKAALLVVGVLCAGIVLFVLFCQYVWLR